MEWPRHYLNSLNRSSNIISIILRIFLRGIHKVEIIELQILENAKKASAKLRVDMRFEANLKLGLWSDFKWYWLFFSWRKDNSLDEWEIVEPAEVEIFADWDEQQI